MSLDPQPLSGIAGEILAGGASLFPLLGNIERLEIFLPRLRRLFTVLSTVFSLIVFISVQSYLDQLSRFPSVPQAVVFSIFCILCYLLYYFSLKDRFDSLRGFRRGILIVLGLLLYGGFVMGMTYSFNFLESYADHHIFFGRVVVEAKDAPSKRPAENAEVIFDCGGDEITTYANSRGKFWKIIPKEICPQVRSATARYRGPGGVVTHGRTWGRDRIPNGTLELREY